jgi:hypothetical protein
MHIEYQLSESDFVAASQFSSHRRTPWRRIRLWLIRLLGAVFVVQGALLLSQPGNKVVNALIFLYGALLCLFSVVTRLLYKRKFRKMTQLHGRYILDPDETSFRYVAPSGETKMEWKVWGSFAEDANSFVLVQRGSSMFMPIPKRELSPEQIAELRILFQTHVARK